MPAMLLRTLVEGHRGHGPLVSAITPRVVAESDVRQADRPLCSSTCRSQGRRTSTSIHSPNS